MPLTFKKIGEIFNNFHKLGINSFPKDVNPLFQNLYNEFKIKDGKIYIKSFRKFFEDVNGSWIIKLGEPLSWKKHPIKDIWLPIQKDTSADPKFYQEYLDLVGKNSLPHHVSEKQLEQLKEKEYEEKMWNNRVLEKQLEQLKEKEYEEKMWNQFLEGVIKDFRNFHERKTEYFPRIDSLEYKEGNYKEFYEKFNKINKRVHNGSLILTEIDLNPVSELIGKNIRNYKLPLGKNHPVKWIKKNENWFPITCQGIHSKDNDLIIAEIEACINEYSRRPLNDRTRKFIENYVYDKSQQLGFGRKRSRKKR